MTFSQPLTSDTSRVLDIASECCEIRVPISDAVVRAPAGRGPESNYNLVSGRGIMN